MDLSNGLRGYLVSECRTAAGLMDSHEDVIDKIYYFSALYGAVQRVLNIEFSDDLALLFTVTHTAYQRLQSRIDAMLQQREQSVQIPKVILDELSREVGGLADRIAGDQDLSEGLARISTLSYLTTGNGYYLLQSRLRQRFEGEM